MDRKYYHVEVNGIILILMNFSSLPFTVCTIFIVTISVVESIVFHSQYIYFIDYACERPH